MALDVEAASQDGLLEKAMSQGLELSVAAIVRVAVPFVGGAAKAVISGATVS
jgi:hypothetical protein